MGIDDMIAKNESTMIEELYESLSISNVSWSEWETDFIESVYAQYQEGRRLTQKQMSFVVKLYNKL